MIQKPDKYWFPAKRYGWGWGIPRTWQGWAVLAAYMAVLVGAAHFLPPARNVLAFSAVIAVASLALLLVCLRKGEPPRWRWGKQ